MSGRLLGLMRNWELWAVLPRTASCRTVFCKTCVALQSLVSLGVTWLFLGVHPSCVDGGSAAVSILGHPSMGWWVLGWALTCCSWWRTLMLGGKSLYKGYG